MTIGFVWYTNSHGASASEITPRLEMRHGVSLEFRSASMGNGYHKQAITLERKSLSRAKALVVAIEADIQGEIGKGEVQIRLNGKSLLEYASWAELRLNRKEKN